MLLINEYVQFDWVKKLQTVKVSDSKRHIWRSRSIRIFIVK